VSHVGIYIGNGKMINASTEDEPVKIDSIDSDEWHNARRI
jgi:cell wall-associated NlpC family hydrolase